MCTCIMLILAGPQTCMPPPMARSSRGGCLRTDVGRTLRHPSLLICASSCRTLRWSTTTLLFDRSCYLRPFTIWLLCKFSLEIYLTIYHPLLPITSPSSFLVATSPLMVSNAHTTCFEVPILVLLSIQSPAKPTPPDHRCRAPLPITCFYPFMDALLHKRMLDGAFTPFKY